MPFKKFFAALAVSVLLGSPVSAEYLTKAEASTCVKRGIIAFFTGEDFVSLLDFKTLFSRSDISLSKKVSAKRLMRQRAKNNADLYEVLASANPYPVVSVKKSSSTDYTIAYGNIRGKEISSDGSKKSFQYQFNVWVKKVDGNCKFAVVDFDGVWKLGVWLRENL